MFKYWEAIVRQAASEAILLVGFDKARKDILRSIGIFALALFLVWYIGGSGQMTEELRWGIATAIAIGVVYLPLFLYRLASIPKIREKGNATELGEHKETLRVLKEERIPRFGVTPSAGRRQYDWEHEHLMWAELRVKNTSPTTPLNDVEVKIAGCLYVLPSQDAEGSHLIVHNYPSWNPTAVYWSERDTNPSQFKLSIPPGSTKTVLVAFQDNSNGGTAVFNAPTYPLVIGGAEVEVEITSPNSPIWVGRFYLECHPNYLGGKQSHFEFVEWDKWEATRNIIRWSNPYTGGSQTE